MQEKTKKKHVCGCGKEFKRRSGLRVHQKNCSQADNEPAEAAEPAPAPEQITTAPESAPDQAPAAQQPAAAVATPEVPAALQPIFAPPAPEPRPPLIRFDVSEFFSWVGDLFKGLFRALAPVLLTVVILSILVPSLFIIGRAGLQQLNNQPAEAQTAVRLDDAVQVVSDYHAALSAGAYQAAYARLSPQWRQRQTLDTFRRECARPLQVNIVEVTSLDTRRALVVADISLGYGPPQKVSFPTVYDGRAWYLSSPLLVNDEVAFNG